MCLCEIDKWRTLSNKCQVMMFVCVYVSVGNPSHTHWLLVKLCVQIWLTMLRLKPVVQWVLIFNSGIMGNRYDKYDKVLYTWKSISHCSWCVTSCQDHLQADKHTDDTAYRHQNIHVPLDKKLWEWNKQSAFSYSELTHKTKKEGNLSPCLNG